MYSMRMSSEKKHRLLGYFFHVNFTFVDIIGLHVFLVSFGEFFLIIVPFYLHTQFATYKTRGSQYEPPHDKNSKMKCAPSEDSDQPGHPPSLISLRWPHEESLRLELSAERTEKTLMRQCGCAGWSEPPGHRSLHWFYHAVAHFDHACQTVKRGMRSCSVWSFVEVYTMYQRIGRVLARLRGCAGWSASLLFAYGISRFAHDLTHRVQCTGNVVYVYSLDRTRMLPCIN